MVHYRSANVVYYLTTTPINYNAMPPGVEHYSPGQ